MTYKNELKHHKVQNSCIFRLLYLYQVYRQWRKSRGRERKRKKRFKKMLAFYSQFIKKSDLCFDIGANTGNRTEAFLKLGATVVAVQWSQPRALELIKKWKDCALTKEYIAPKGSSRDNHRQDQAVLTILAYEYGFAQIIPQRCLGFKIHQDID